MSFNSTIQKAASSSIVALTGKTAGSTTGATALAMASTGPENGSLVANVSIGLTTSTTTVITKWQGSQDGVTYYDIYGINSPAFVAVAAAGTGSIVTTAYVHACPINPSFPYMRLACQVGVATAGAGDNVTISYNWRKRSE